MKSSGCAGFEPPLRGPGASRLDAMTSTPWRATLLASAAVLVLSLAPPWLPPAPARGVEAAFSWVCHQLPDRTLHVGGAPVALCHRCLGILGGLVAGLALAPLVGRVPLETRAQARWLVAAGLPTTMDWTLTALGLWANTPLSRSVTGALFGVAAGLLAGASLTRRPAATQGPEGRVA